MSQHRWEFAAGTVAGALLALYGYVVVDTLCRLYLGFALPPLLSVFGLVVVALFAIRIGQWRVRYWESADSR